MRVEDLAKELKTTSDAVLARLRTLKLKAKDSQQELNSAVLAVLRSEFKKTAPPPAKTKELPKVSAVEKKPWDKKEKAIKGPAKVRKESGSKEKGTAKKSAKAKGEKPGAIPKKISKTKEIKPRSSAGGAEKKDAVQKPAPRLTAKAQEQAVASAEKAIKEKAGAAAKETPKMSGSVAAPAKEPARVITPPKIEARPVAPAAVRMAPKAQPPMREIKAVAPEVKRALGPLEIQLPISVKDLAVRIQKKPSIILKKLLEVGIFATINQNLDEETVNKLGVDFGFSLAKFKTPEEQLVESHTVEEDPKLLKPRSPVVTFMGHVDHGKTSLLDKIRKSRVADTEHGGITQHIGAYSVNLPKGRITFLDTPGHEAFTSMRARGAHITDLVVLVVAADEGIMPQTEEAINHARAAGVPIIVALNKIDKKGVDLDLVKKQLAAKDLNPEDWGGKTICVGVSALTGEGIDRLLEMILLEAELLELKANYEKQASGIVVEAQLSRGKGPIATVIVQNGILHEGDNIIVGPHAGRIKAMLDDHERPVKEAGPATPVEILGLSGVPEAGEMFYAIDDEKQAREIVGRRQQQIKMQKMQPLQKITLEDLYAQIQEGKIKELNIIVKADVQGSLGALTDSLVKIVSSEVQLKIIHTGVGEVTASDVILAEASNAIIIGFNVQVSPRAASEMEKRLVDVRTYRIIYDAINDVKMALQGLLEPKTKKKFLGRVEIRQVLKLSKSGIVAGCFVAKGKVTRKVMVDVVRNGEVVFSGSLSSLKRFKDDVREVTEGFECGLTINGFDAIQVGDIIDAYELEKIARTL